MIVKNASDVETQRRLRHGGSRSLYVFVLPVDFQLLQQLRVDQSQLLSVLYLLSHSSELRPVAKERAVTEQRENHPSVESDASSSTKSS